MDTKYLDGTPDSFRKSCDVLLKLDDSSKLPAHALFLARYSKVFAAMLDDGPLSAASVLNKAELPLADCSKTAALSLLAVIYSNKESKNISKESSMAVASLAHRLDMQDVVGLCDDVISGASSTPNGKLPQSSSLLEKKDLKGLVDLMESAEQFGMRKCLACCEYCIAHDTSGRFNNALKSIPPGGPVRIAGCIDQLSVLRDYPIKTWSPEYFLRNNINWYKA